MTRLARTRPLRCSVKHLAVAVIDPTTVAFTHTAVGVRLNCVSPGYMRTPMSTGERLGLDQAAQDARVDAFGRLVPMQRAGSVDDIAAAVAYLASDDACYVTGQEIVVDGGYLVG